MICLTGSFRSHLQTRSHPDHSNQGWWSKRFNEPQASISGASVVSQLWYYSILDSPSPVRWGPKCRTNRLTVMEPEQSTISLWLQCGKPESTSRLSRYPEECHEPKPRQFCITTEAAFQQVQQRARAKVWNQTKGKTKRNKTNANKQ